MSHAVGAGLDTLKVDPEVAASPGPGPLASIELKPIVSPDENYDDYYDNDDDDDDYNDCQVSHVLHAGPHQEIKLLHTIHTLKQ